ncbi:purine-cytosine permease family protein [Alicyclobacillus tolerans]|uniref:Purine-cytosine permease n=2 Tax=Alicyclobacillus tolerans TaxID=90970 RepID=A0A1M6R6Z1_9BACL|nr:MULTISPECIES: cytosine permease [Alicyclobacillus]MDP9729489.1 purine-cytosine permease-like protein [Alicyclobacillus tengchongensis]QRF22405.1 allantoin permease [Alicyclobacillus sp. TC]SHK28251.1 Purine-cytosine permease [Alicyclobacillus montanus]
MSQQTTTLVHRQAAEDTAFRVETLGTEIVPASQRHGKPRELFFVWFAAVLTYTGVTIGQLFTSLGLNVWESFLAAIICSISFALLGYASCAGPKGGTVTLTLSKASFGVLGNKVPALFSWLSAVGWEAVTMVLTVYAMLSLAGYIGLPSSGIGPTIVALILTLILTYSVPVLGHATVITMQRILSYILAACTIILIFAILPKVHWGFSVPVKDMAAHGSWPTFLMALSIGLISTFYGWVNFAADYSRYLPAQTSAGKIVSATFWGGGIASLIMMGVGILLGTFVNPQAFASNPVGAIAHAVPAWAAIPFLIVVVLGDIAANYLNAYSSGMSFLSLGVPMKRYGAVLLDGALCTLIAIYPLFISPQFMNFFSNFLSLNIIVIGPWATIFLLHHFLIRGRYSENGLASNQPHSDYWYQGGIHWEAIVSFIIGIVATILCVNSQLYVSPLSNQLFGGADLSAYAAPIVTGMVYYLLASRKIRKQANLLKSAA